MTGYTITGFRAKPLTVGLISGETKPGYVATVVFDSGDFIGVSQIEGEAYWVMDARFKANGFPVFSNGEGSRCTALNVLKADHPLTVALDARKA